MRLIMMGTAPFAVPALEVLAAGPHEVVAVYTQPPRPAGRGHKLQQSAVHEAALRLGLPVHHPATLKDPAVQESFAAHRADLAVVAAYGLLLPRPVLAAPRLGCINLHGSILPRWRGAAPVQRAIMAGDGETGVCIFQMEPGMDTGPVFACRSTPIGPRDTSATLLDRLAGMAAGMLPELIQAIDAGTIAAVPQPEAGITHAPKIAREEARLDWSWPAERLDRMIRAITCWCEAQGERLTILEAEPVPGGGEPGRIVGLPLTVACGQGALRIAKAVRAGRKPMTAEELQRGFALPLGTRLG